MCVCLLLAYNLWWWNGFNEQNNWWEQLLGLVNVDQVLSLYSYFSSVTQWWDFTTTIFFCVFFFFGSLHIHTHTHTISENNSKINKQSNSNKEQREKREADEKRTKGVRRRRKVRGKKKRGRERQAVVFVMMGRFSGRASCCKPPKAHVLVNGLPRANAWRIVSLNEKRRKKKKELLPCQLLKKKKRKHGVSAAPAVSFPLPVVFILSLFF